MAEQREREGQEGEVVGNMSRMGEVVVVADGR